jgi:YwiC-like protein
VNSDGADGPVRADWRGVAVPTEHGGWGLTAEPVMLGLLVAFSWPGLLIGLVALLAFLARTPVKLLAVDHRRGRWLERDRRARRVALIEVTLLVVFGVVALVAAGPGWLVPVVLALPLVAVEFWYDVRSRSRRLVPELCGAAGVSATAAAIIVAGDGSVALAAAAWLVLCGRVLASIPFVRTQIRRLRHGDVSRRLADRMQVIGVVVAAVAVAVDRSVALGAGVVALVAVVQMLWMRRTPVPPATTIGIRQMVIGFAVVAATAVGVLASS